MTNAPLGMLAHAVRGKRHTGFYPLCLTELHFMVLFQTSMYSSIHMHPESELWGGDVIQDSYLNENFHCLFHICPTDLFSAQSACENRFCLML